MLPPYHTGAAKSRLLGLLQQGHYGVRLSRKEIDIIACWIDLGVPYCGDYLEANAWSKRELETYQYCLKKRQEQENLERCSASGEATGKRRLQSKKTTGPRSNRSDTGGQE